MSVGLYYNKQINDFHHINHFKKDNIHKVKRKLSFGPIDHEETKWVINQELDRHRVLQSERWNFDFLLEKPLSTDGIYEWKPATPIKNIRPIKRRNNVDDEGMEFDNQELYCLPDNIFKPIAVKPFSNENTHEETSLKNNKTQSLITDFMPIKKCLTTESSSKKLMPRPNKIPRLGNELINS